jgi:pimeloyl-ACP methyl ester carboxylesterase
MEKEIVIDGCKIFYEETGEGKTVALLHGWGCDHTIFKCLQDFLNKNFRVIAIDLPGFGKSDKPKKVLSIEDYANDIEEFFNLLKIKNPILIGHSFGGRISIIVGSRNKITKIILIDSAGIKPIRKPSYYIKVYTYKALKNIGKIKLFNSYIEKIKGKMGSNDYKTAQGIMRQIMVRVVNTDLKEYLPKILAPTLLLWGEKDTITPLKDAYVMKKLINDAGIVVFNNCGHYSFLEQPNETNIIINNFIKDDIYDNN